MAITYKQIKASLYNILAISTIALVAACGTSANDNVMQQEASPEVEFITLSTGNAGIEKKYPGTIEGKVNVDIKAQATGYLAAIYVKEGDYVKSGQTLFRIKGDALNAQISNSEAALSAALANQATAKLEVEKTKPLVAGKVVTDIQLQTAESNFKATVAAVAQAKAALKAAQINADFSVIKAPVSGYIGRIPNRIGNLVTPADTNPMTTLSEIDEVYVYFAMSDADYLRILKAGKSNSEKITGVDLILSDGTLYGIKGKLETASGNIDRTTGTISMKAIFPNPDKFLRSGGSVRVVINTALSSVMTIPMASVKDIQDKFFVYTLGDSNKVNMQPMEIAGKSGQNYLVKSGLKSGDRIATNNIEILAQGMVVKPKVARP
ncbi:efflux RND transporter periplasmic adaptor subunit [Pedobacter soli]|uniref:Membrane fusion protein, multidrug efflux system n=1 Tax=Pedobacter soli TaxID=390242 RepID=A0A1G6SBE8_9SPHI|nr:efflux RND transporter periplasmic adaptor subunit [Pedobacter soli]SDD13457.1 membrane fusion protein, multidrug efflux system [Pedobacter soli]